MSAGDSCVIRLMEKEKCGMWCMGAAVAVAVKCGGAVLYA